MRVVVLAALLLISPVALARAGAPARDLLYLAPGPHGDSVYVATAAGADVVDLTGGFGLAADPSWSPDGTQAAWSTNRDVGGAGGSEIYVASADGGLPRRLTFDATQTANSKTWPAWSPDGSTIAYLRDGRQIWLVPAAGGASRFLADLGNQATEIHWSPDGSSLLTVESGGPFILRVNATTGALDGVAVGDEPQWSPDGRRIAYYDPRGNSIAVVDPDGRNARDLTTFPSRDPQWTPDGNRLVFTGTTSDTGVSPGKFGYPSRVDVWSIPSAGGAPSRLTGPFDPGDFGTPWAIMPVPSPDGSRLAFREPAQVWAANADGSCAHSLGLGGVEQGPFWRPGSTGARLDCVDLTARATVPAAQVALNREATAVIRVENHGTRVAHDVVVHVAPANLDTALIGCGGGGPDCALGDIPPGATATAVAAFSRPTAGNAAVTFTAASFQDPDITPTDANGVAGVAVLPCTVVGTWTADHLVGTAGDDRICGLPGPDWISGGTGDDYLDGGSGNDTIFAGPGHDTILGKGGRDTIFARDGERDWIDCGSEYDVAVVDKIDVVRHCERVLRK